MAADRAVSATSVRFVQGMLPEIERKLSVEDRTEAYITRDQIAEHTGLAATAVLPKYYPKQLAETGIVRMTRQGRFGLVETEDGEWRGHSSGWIADTSAYTPTDIPQLELETEDYVLDFDRRAIVRGLLPTTNHWAKNINPHRLILALIHHVGIRRVKLDAKTAAEILGACRATGWRVLQQLKELGFYEDGWVDYGLLLVDPQAILADAQHTEQVRLAKVRRWSVFTRAGREIQGYARQWIEIWRTLSEEDVRPVFWRGMSNGMTRAVDYVRQVFERDALLEPRIEI